MGKTYRERYIDVKEDYRTYLLALLAICSHPEQTDQDKIKEIGTDAENALKMFTTL